MGDAPYRATTVGLEWLQRSIRCQAACPVSTNVPRYIELLAKGELDAAYAVNQRANVFPAILGRVCAHFCEAECRRSLIDSPVAICALKRAICDLGGGPDRRPEDAFAPATGKSVAIIGAGPAGLAAASDLLRWGHRVVVFEALSVPGGMLRVGIPAYRLPREVITQAVSDLQTLGVQIHLESPVGDKVQLDDLMSEHAAVFIAAGAHKPEKLGIEGEDLPCVLYGVTFMRHANLGEPVDIGRRAVVIGGGNTAMDACRTAVRLGADDVTVVYRRTRAEMPVDEREVEQAEEEGVRFIFLASPVRVTQGDSSAQLQCIRNELGEPDGTGRRRPVAIAGSEFTIDVDTLIAAVSQAPDVSFLPDGIGLTMSQWDTLDVNEDTLATNVAGVFAGGDFVSGPTDVVNVIADGHRAARSIDAYLSGGTPSVESVPVLHRVGEQRCDHDAYIAIPRRRMPTISVGERVDLEREVDKGLDAHQALREAQRCLQCHLNIHVNASFCVLCGGCVDVCPYGCIRMVPVDRIDGDAPELAQSRSWEAATAIVMDDEFCIRCGLCVRRCPTGAIGMYRFEMKEVLNGGP